MFKNRCTGKLKSILVSMAILLAFFNPMLIASATGSDTISIGSATVNLGDTVMLPITIADVTDVTGVDVTVVYDANIVTIQNVAVNSSVSGSNVFPNIDNMAGKTIIAFTNTEYITTTSAVPIIDITFKVVGSSGSSTLELQEVELSDASFNVYVPGTINNGEIIIASSNNAPVASDQSVTTPEDTSIDITLSASDVDGDSLTYSIVDDSSHGTVTLSGNTATYTPVTNYNGADSFTFKANDGTVDSNTATVSITISAVNNAPVASDQSVTTPEDTSVEITLSATDVDGDSLTYSIVGDPSHGTVTLSGNTATYTPATNYNGADSFTFKANDGTVDSNTATVSITVSAVNNAPVAFGVSDASGAAGSTVSVPLEIANVSNGPIQTIMLYMDYNKSVISLESVNTSPLTAGWIFELGDNNHSITLTTSNQNKAIPNGTTDDVAYLNFLIVGGPGDTCLMTPENIDFSNTANEHGTATAKIGAFEILTFGSISGRVSHSNNGTAISEVIVELIQDDIVIATTTTSLTGEYTFVDLLSGTYELEFSEAQFYDESSGVVEVYAGVNTIVDMSLRLIGDLDNNGVQADAADVNMMMQASVKDITANRYFDLDGNGNYADAVDVNMMLQASVKDIILS